MPSLNQNEITMRLKKVYSYESDGKEIFRTTDRQNMVKYVMSKLVIDDTTIDDFVVVYKNKMACYTTDFVGTPKSFMYNINRSKI